MAAILSTSNGRCDMKPATEDKCKDGGLSKRSRVRSKVTRVIAVAGDAQIDKQTEIKVQFRLEAANARSVAVAGSFNNWNPKKMPLVKDANGWTATLLLPRGSYEYRFVVDGAWMSDPSARESVANGYGESNSVLSV